MTEETRTSKLAAAVDQITRLGGLAERTRIDTNLEVIDATGGIAGAGYIIIEDQEGYNVPAVRLSGVPYTNGDLVNVLYVEGTEPIAFQQGSGSVNPEQGKVSKIWQPDFSDVVGEANNTNLDFLHHGGLTITGALKANEGGEDIDSYVKGDNDANLTYWDAGNDRLGVGTNTPATKLDVRGVLTVNNSGATGGLDVYATDGHISMRESDASNKQWFFQVNNSDFRITEAGVAQRLIIQDTTGYMGVNEASPGASLHVAGISQTLNSSFATVLWPQSRVGVAGSTPYQGVGSRAAGLLEFPANMEYNGTNFIARATTAALKIISGGGPEHIWYLNTGLTAGNTFSPAVAMRLNTTGLGLGATPGSPLEINLPTADLEIVDSGTAAATEAGWIEVQIGGATHYIRTFLAK